MTKQKTQLTRDTVSRFVDWMAGCGALPIPTRSTDEVHRMLVSKHYGKLAIVYRNRSGLFVSGPASALYKAFVKGHTGITLAPESVRISKPARLVYQLFERDGPHCFYCGVEFMSPEDPALTLEEVFAVSKGGFRCEDNCALACNRCNVKVGNLPVVEKIKMRDEMRAKWLT